MNPNRKLSKTLLPFFLLGLLCLSIAGIAFRSLFYPYLQQEKQFKKQIELVAHQKNELTLYMKKAETYPHELSSIQKEIASIENTFFTHLSQEEVIVLLDLLAEKNDILLNEILFDKNSTSTSAITNIPLDAVTISLLVTGTYDNCLLFIQSIEGLANNLTLTNFEMGIQADSSLQLKLNLLFYSWAYADEQTD